MRHKKGMLYLFGAFAFAGSSVVAVRFIDNRLGTFTIASISLILAVLFLLPFAAKDAFRVVRSMRRESWSALFSQAVFGIFLYRTLMLLGLLQTSSSEAGLLTGTTPAFTVLFSMILLREKMGRNKWLGLLLAAAGIVLLQKPDAEMLRGTVDVAHLLGNLFVLGAAVCESLFSVLSRRNALRVMQNAVPAMTPATQTLLVSAMAALLCLVPALWENPLAVLPTLTPSSYLSLVWYGVFVTAVGYIFLYAGIRRCEASTAAAFAGMVPFTAVLLSALILKEQPTMVQLLGGGLIISSMVTLGLQRPVAVGIEYV